MVRIINRSLKNFVSHCIIRQLTLEKLTNKCTVIVFLSLKFIYFIYRTDMFRLFPSHHQGACYMVQLKNNNVHIFQDTVIYISNLQFQFTHLLKLQIQ